MILNTGSRTDIPGYFSEWFYNRVKAGTVMVRNPFNPQLITEYKLDPKLVDVLCFCTKNPTPMLERIAEIDDFNQFWFVTITPYGKDIEPGVPDKQQIIETVKILSTRFESNNIGWRFDPIFISSKYTIDYHLHAFETIAKQLGSYISQCTISFIDLYEKTKKNFPQAQAVTDEQQVYITQQFVKIADKYGFKLYTCSENPQLAKYGVDVSGCMTKQVLEAAAGFNLKVPKAATKARPTCNCLLGSDIGAYNTCSHGCKYCYANYDMSYVRENRLNHNPNSPLLIGDVTPEDTIKVAKQVSYRDDQLTLF